MNGASSNATRGGGEGIDDAQWLLAPQYGTRMTSRRGNITREALQNYWPNSLVDHRLHPLPQFNCVYVRNAKVGTGTTLLWLHRVHTGDHAFSPVRSIHAEQRLPKPDDVGWDRVIEMLEGGAFRFAFVRDPVRRVESAFLNKVAGHPSHGGRGGDRRMRALQQALGRRRGSTKGITLDEFVAALEILAAEDVLKMDAHWRPQHLNLMHGLVTYDLVGRLESFDADLERVRAATGMPKVPVEVWRNASAASSHGQFEGRPDLLQKVRHIYARDFEIFGY
jgi:Sulfotransferase family